MIELTAPAGASFTFEGSNMATDADLLSRDRITIIDCGGTCGISSPTKSVLVAGGPADRIDAWNDFPARSYFADAAHVDAENPTDPDLTVQVYREAPKSQYTEFTGKYVAGYNLNLKDFSVPLDGDMRPLAAHACFQKCSEGCVGDTCYCGGYFSGVDVATSNSLCADQALCQYLCDNLEGCASIDMHGSLDRCFLNDAMADTHVDSLAKDADYNVLVKRADPNQEHKRKLQESILAVRDFGYSWGQMLRFKDIMFKSGGTFKLCFCDSSLLATGSACRSEADYGVEVGTIHASGVSCLIAKPELQRVNCVRQHWGALRCYRQYTEPPQPTPPAIGPVTTVSLGGGGGPGAPNDLTTKCAMMTEEEAKNDPDCAGQ